MLFFLILLPTSILFTSCKYLSHYLNNFWNALVWEAASRMAPDDPSHLISTTLWNLLPLSVSWLCDSLPCPVTIIWQRGWGYHFRDKVIRDCDCHLASRFSLLPSWLHDLMKQTTSLAWQGSDAVSPTAHEEVNSTNNHEDLEAELLPTVSSDETLGLADILITAIVVSIPFYYTVS